MQQCKYTELFIFNVNILNFLQDKNKGAIPSITKKTQNLWQNIISFNQRSQFRKNIEHGVILWLPVGIKEHIIKSKLLLEHCSLSSKIKSNNCHLFQSILNNLFNCSPDAFLCYNKVESKKTPPHRNNALILFTFSLHRFLS